MPSSIISRLMPLCRADGSVLTAVRTSLDSRPLLMKVFWPLTIQWSPSSRAVVLMPARSDPAAGSDIAIEPMYSPETNLGSQRAFCSSVVRSFRYGTRMSFCTPRPMPTEPVRNISSETIWLNRKSLTPRPPYFSSNSQPIRPAAPAASHASRLTLPSRSHFSTCGTHSRSKKLLAVARKSSWISSKMLRRMDFPLLGPGDDGRQRTARRVDLEQPLAEQRFEVIVRPAERVDLKATCDVTVQVVLGGQADRAAYLQCHVADCAVRPPGCGLGGHR